MAVIHVLNLALPVDYAVPMIMGANIGTTITAHLIAFNVIHLALLLAIIGFALINALLFYESVIVLNSKGLK